MLLTMGKCLGRLVFSAGQRSVSKRHFAYRNEETRAKTTMITSASSDVGRLKKSLEEEEDDGQIDDSTDSLLCDPIPTVFFLFEKILPMLHCFPVEIMLSCCRANI